MEKYFEINYTIEDIQGMSREEQLEYLEYLYDLQTEIMRQIDDAYHIKDKSHKEVIIDILTTLSNNKDKFEEIANR